MSVPLLVLRHGATDWNARRRIQGRADPPLSEAGRVAVDRWRLPSEWVGVRCLTSPLVRAVETARRISMKPRIEPRLIEMDWGAWEGRALADLRAEFGPAMAENEARGLDFRPPGGESPREVQARVASLLNEIAEPTIAVTHKGVIRALYALATGWTMRDKPPQKLRDGCAHVLEVSAGGALALVRLNVPLVSGK
jgi:probable phosphoglycerate mutase